MTDPLIQLGIQLTRIVVPMTMALGIIGNSVNIVVLTRPALYNYACSRYLLAVGWNGLIFTSFVLICRLLADGYQYDVTQVSLLSCKLVTYIYHVCAVLSPYLIVLASIDRFCASSTNAHLRKFSSVKVTRWALIFVIFIILLFYINTPILVDLQSTDFYGCAIRADTTYKQIYPIIQVVLFAIIIPILMIFFGVMTIYNTKQIRVMPTISRHRRTENQLIAMLLIQVITHLVLSVPACTTYLIGILPNTIKSTYVFYFILTVSQLLFNVSFATPFILYLMSARTYRKEFFILIYKIFGLRIANQIRPTTNSIANTMMQTNTVANRL